MSRKVLWALVVLFVLARAPMAWLAARPDIYEHNGIVTANDVLLYENWSAQMIDDGRGAYSDVPIEYPPGSLPFMLGPQVANGDNSYLIAFIVMMVAIDLAGLLGLMVMARRSGSALGPLLWILAVVALGPIAYLRLDLVPAVASVWAFERASADDWMGAGGWIGVGAIAKLYPLLFVPAGLILALRRQRFGAAAAVVFVAPLVPLIPNINAVASSVLGYHADRGIQVESLWGGILFIAQRSGADAGIEFSFGALHFMGPLSETLKPVATIASLVALLIATALAWRIKNRRERTKAFPEICFVVLAFSLTTGTVFSPQFLAWLIAVGAAVACIRDSRLRPLAVLLVPIAALTHALFPFLYTRLLFGETLPLVLLWVRNGSVAAIAVGATFLLWRDYARPVNVPSIPEPASG
ncbi:MAG: DUF2029 domain-containing protein [Actinobacteria bacterium]|nr:DUF2029 domain-containing protein [Actinomycetota bacterium]